MREAERQVPNEAAQPTRRQVAPASTADYASRRGGEAAAPTRGRNGEDEERFEKSGGARHLVAAGLAKARPWHGGG